MSPAVQLWAEIRKSLRYNEYWGQTNVAGDTSSGVETPGDWSQRSVSSMFVEYRRNDYSDGYTWGSEQEQPWPETGSPTTFWELT